MRQRDERIDNEHHKAKGEVLYDKRPQTQPIKARDDDCQACALKHRCLKNPATGKGRTVSLFGRALVDDNDPSQKMRNAIDSARQDQGGHAVQLYCLVHNIEKIVTQAMRSG
jgi:hypothetical protein